MRLESIMLIEPQFLQHYVEMLDGFDQSRLDLTTLDDMLRPQIASDILTIEGDRATIEITGPLSPEGPGFFDRLFQIGGTSFKAIHEAIVAIEAEDDVKAVDLLMDTPGSTATGTDETFQALVSLAGKKKLTAINLGMIASGGYWLSLAADEIVAAAPIALTGSIGAVIVGFDFTEQMKAFGVKRVVITSKNAPDKAPSISDEAGIKILQARVDAAERAFIDRVAEHRSVTTEKVMSDFGRGDLLIAQDTGEGKPDALSVGMIDKVTAPLGQPIKSNSSEVDIEAKPITTDSSGGTIAMTLQEFLKENPDAKGTYDAALSKADSDGYARCKGEVGARVKVAAPILASDDYQPAIKKLAVEVVTGEATPDSLKSALAVIDSQKEADAEAATKADGEANADTPPGPGEGDGSGEITTEADIKSAGAKMRAQASGGA